jgi:hypothetical protein
MFEVGIAWCWIVVLACIEWRNSRISLLLFSKKTVILRSCVT